MLRTGRRVFDHAPDTSTAGNVEPSTESARGTSAASVDVYARRSSSALTASDAPVRTRGRENVSVSAAVRDRRNSGTVSSAPRTRTSVLSYTHD